MSSADLQPSQSRGWTNRAGGFDEALKRAAAADGGAGAQRAVDRTVRRGFLDVERAGGSTADDTNVRDSETAKRLYRVVIDGDDGGTLLRLNAERLHRAVEMRRLYYGCAFPKRTIDASLPPIRHNVGVTWRGGVASHADVDLDLPSYRTYIDHVQDLYLSVESSSCNDTCRQRLLFIQEIGKMTTLLNIDHESSIGHTRPGGVFAAAAKVDNSVILESCLPAHEVLDVVVDQFEKAPHDPICKAADGSNITLADIVADAHVASPAEFTVAGLQWQPNRHNAARFDAFRSDGTKSGTFSTTVANGAMRYTGGLFPPIVQRLVRKLEHAPSQQAGEFRVTLLGRSPDELMKGLSNVFKTHSLGPNPTHTMWFIRVGFFDFAQSVAADRAKAAERLAEMAGVRGVNKKDREAAQALVDAKPPTVGDFLHNVFAPMLEASLRPETSGSTAWFLAQCGGIHLESRAEKAGRLVVPPKDLGTPDTVAFDDPRVNDAYIDYYVWANFTLLNTVRARARLNTFQLRRTIGGVAGLGPIIAGYLFADVMTNAAVLDDYFVLQYLAGIHRIGVTVSPLMNNIHSVRYKDSPLARMFCRSLTIAVATEAPMQYHNDGNPLVEELATAQKLLGLSGSDMAELARNSVRISSFPRHVKQDWLGEGGNAHLGPQCRYRADFREESWRNEAQLVQSTFQDIKSGGQESESVALWSKLSTVTDEEYFSVRDKRVRFPRTIIVEPRTQTHQPAVRSAAQKIVRALEMRATYIWKPPRPFMAREVTFEEALSKKRGRKSEWTYASKDSVFIAFKRADPQNWPAHLCTLEQFHRHLMELKGICDNVDVKDLAYRRLELLEYKFRLHLALNEENEAGANEGAAGMHNRDFYHASKVDTHIHMAAGMTGRHLRAFVVDKLANNRDDIVARDPASGKVSTFAGVAKGIGVTENLTVDQLNVQADHTLFERFDNFNNKYNPMAQGILRTLLLKTDNYMNGRYFAELINQTFAEYAKDQYTFAENRVSIYGIKLTEWDSLADWFDTHGMGSKHNKWLIQVPRVYKVFRGNNTISSFGQYIENIFKPLWDVSMEPHRYPRLHNFLAHVSGFDSVDNEATIDLPFSTLSPWQWTAVENPPYNYYMYHLWANIRTLNEFRSSQGLDTFTLRPHCGESGSDEHLIGCFLASDAINHGINLKHDPSMEYLYYLAQVGLAVSPLSNNALFLYFLKNPFDGFFRRGLNVSLSTDDPLMFHQTREPLIEEYSIAAKVWGFSMNDLCELARNSVLQSGYSAEWKAEKLGPRFFFSSSLGNDPNKSHMSNIRQAYRFEAYHAEMALLDRLSGRPVPRSMTTAAEENRFVEEEQWPESAIIVSTQNEGMERLQRDIRERKERITKTRGELEDATRLHRGLVEQVSDLGGRIGDLEAEVAELEKPPPRAEVTYRAPMRAQGHRGDPTGLVDLPPREPRPQQELWSEFLKTPDQRTAEERDRLDQDRRARGFVNAGVVPRPASTPGRHASASVGTPSSIPALAPSPGSLAQSPVGAGGASWLVEEDGEGDGDVNSSGSGVAAVVPRRTASSARSSRSGVGALPPPRASSVPGTLPPSDFRSVVTPRDQRVAPRLPQPDDYPMPPVPPRPRPLH